VLALEYAAGSPDTEPPTLDICELRAVRSPTAVVSDDALGTSSLATSTRYATVVSPARRLPEEVTEKSVTEALGYVVLSVLTTAVVKIRLKSGSFTGTPEKTAVASTKI
jgi:hypothetical protein